MAHQLHLEVAFVLMALVAPILPPLVVSTKFGAVIEEVALAAPIVPLALVVNVTEALALIVELAAI